MVRLLAAGAAALALAAVATPSLAAGEPTARTITLSGDGVATGVPDVVVVTLGVVSEADSAAAALEANNRDMTATVQGLRDAGIEERDIRTANFSIEPRYTYPSDANGNQLSPQIVAYQVTNQVTVRLRDFDGAGSLLTEVVTLGANSVQGIAFLIDDPSALEDEARRDAFEEAHARAEVYAAAGGFKLGNIVSITEGGSYYPQPVMYSREAEAAPAPMDVPLAAGEQEIAITATVTWEIQ